MARTEQPTPPGRVLRPLIALVICALLWPALLTFDLGDWPSPHQFPPNTPVVNACGPVGAWCAYYLHWWLGDGSYVLLLFCTIAVFTKLIQGGVGRQWERAIGLMLLVPATATAVHLIAVPGPNCLPVGPGGVIGAALGTVLQTSLSQLGTVIVLGAAFFVGLVFATEGWVLRVPSLVREGGRGWGAALWALLRSAVQRALASPPAPALAAAPRAASPRSQPRINNGPARSAGRPDDEDEPAGAKSADDAEPGEADDEDEPAAAPKRKSAKAGSSTKQREPASEAANDDEPEAPSANAAVAAAVRVRIPEPKPAPVEPYPRQIENWTLPSLDLLGQSESSFTAEQEVFVREQAMVLERTLEEFRLDAHVVEIDTGPVITMFELRLGAGIKVSQIASLSNDIARALKAHAIRVVAPISGKNTVGIEVPNARKETVRLRELMQASGARASKMALPLFLGKDAGGQSLVADLTKMPHLLIAGTTGSGKSVCLNSIIASVLMTQRPDRVKMIMVDPKMVELSQYKSMPHLMCPIVTDMARAEKILEWAVTKMEERYELLAEARVKNIAGYNGLTPEQLYDRFAPANEQERKLIPLALPYIVVIIDELADLMMTSAKEVEHYLSRLAQKSRAVGIHIIVATQRPEAKVVTGLIKSNLPCRIAFRVASRMDSRIVLDQNGGEVLMGQGDMLFLPPGSHKLLRAQGTFLDDAEIQRVLDYLAERAEPEFHPELVRLKSADGQGDLALRDPLFDQAVRIVLESKRGSVSLLQRRLTIGYSRASRLIDQMADAGIVGTYKGSQAREVTMTVEEWEALQQQVAADLQAGYAADDEGLVPPVRASAPPIPADTPDQGDLFAMAAEPEPATPAPPAPADAGDAADEDEDANGEGDAEEEEDEAEYEYEYVEDDGEEEEDADDDESEEEEEDEEYEYEYEYEYEEEEDGDEDEEEDEED